MSFYGSSFSFDGVSCEEYGLMLYDFGSASQGDSEYAHIEVLEDRIPRHTRSLFYGTQYKDPLEFKLVFGADEEAVQSGEPIDRQDMEVIGSWLLGHQEYKWLVFDQPDLEGIRYRCVITDLKAVELAMCKWAFECTVRCDSPFAYTLPQEFRYEVDGSRDVVLYSRSSANVYYYPEVLIQLNDSADFSIENHSDSNRTFALSNIQQTSDFISICGDTGIITSASGLNIYPCFNFVFPRFVRGDNKLTISGTGIVTFRCSFPVNVGG